MVREKRARHAYYGTLLEAGVRVFEWQQPSTLHDHVRGRRAVVHDRIDELRKIRSICPPIVGSRIVSVDSSFSASTD